VQLHSAANCESTKFFNTEPGPVPFFICPEPQVRMIPLLTNSLVFDCLNTKVLKSLETILHSFEFLSAECPCQFRTSPMTRRGSLERYESVRVTRILLVSQIGVVFKRASRLHHVDSAGRSPRASSAPQIAAFNVPVN